MKDASGASPRPLPQGLSAFRIQRFRPGMPGRKRRYRGAGDPRVPDPVGTIPPGPGGNHRAGQQRPDSRCAPSAARLPPVRTRPLLAAVAGAAPTAPLTGPPAPPPRSCPTARRRAGATA
ncbi:hypothetical protein GCM10027028_17050 [Streptomyces sundarbansensis]